VPTGSGKQHGGRLYLLISMQLLDAEALKYCREDTYGLDYGRVEDEFPQVLPDYPKIAAGARSFPFTNLVNLLV
jgi:hypothetical protein